jgi:chemotaxis protein CheX
MIEKGLHAQVVLSLCNMPSKSATARLKDWCLPESEWAALVETVARELFCIMLGSSVIRVEAPCPAEADMTAMVGLAGSLCGVLSVKCSSETARLIAAKMLGDAVQGGEAARDALGEIANVVAGGIKTKVPGLEDTCFLSTPTVVIGNSFKIYSLGASVTVEVPLDVDGARVWFILDVNHSDIHC